MLKLSDFPIRYSNGKIYNSSNQIILDIFKDKYVESDLSTLCSAANYGKRFLLIKKMKTFQNISTEDAKDLITMECLSLGFVPSKKEEEELEYTIKIIQNSNNIFCKPEIHIMYFKKK